MSTPAVNQLTINKTSIFIPTDEVYIIFSTKFIFKMRVLNMHIHIPRRLEPLAAYGADVLPAIVEMHSALMHFQILVAFEIGRAEVAAKLTGRMHRLQMHGQRLSREEELGASVAVQREISMSL